MPHGVSDADLISQYIACLPHSAGNLDDKLLVDDFEDIWNHFLSLKKKMSDGAKVRIDIILDNAGQKAYHNLVTQAK